MPLVFRHLYARMTGRRVRSVVVPLVFRHLYARMTGWLYDHDHDPGTLPPGVEGRPDAAIAEV